MSIKKTIFVSVLFQAIIFSGELEQKIIILDQQKQSDFNYLELVNFDVQEHILDSCDTNSLCTLRAASRTCNNMILDFCSLFNIENFLEKRNYGSKKIRPTFKERVFSYWFITKTINDDVRVKETGSYFAVETLNLGNTEKIFLEKYNNFKCMQENVDQLYRDKLSLVFPQAVSFPFSGLPSLLRFCHYVLFKKIDRTIGTPTSLSLLYNREKNSEKLEIFLNNQIKAINSLFEQRLYGEKKKNKTFLLNMLCVCLHITKKRFLTVSPDYLKDIVNNVLWSERVNLDDSIESKTFIFVINEIAKIKDKKVSGDILKTTAEKLIEYDRISRDGSLGAKSFVFIVNKLARGLKDNDYLAEIAKKLIEHKYIEEGVGKESFDLIVEVLTENQRYDYLQDLEETLKVYFA